MVKLGGTLFAEFEVSESTALDKLISQKIDLAESHLAHDEENNKYYIRTNNRAVITEQEELTCDEYKYIHSLLSASFYLSRINNK